MDPSSKSPVFEDSAEFWLGKVVAIAELERSGMSKAAAMDAIQSTIRKMHTSQHVARAVARRNAVNQQGA